jgi:RimJ/RimL family protein N-acetyltransferase
VKISLETQRLRLVPLAADHADSLYRVYTEPAVAQFLFTRPRSSDEFAAIFDRALQFGESHGMWALLSREDETLVGRVGFFAFGEAGRPELAYLLSRPAWGRGLATEACARALDHALQSHSWHEVVALIRPTNTAAVRVVEKLGFSLESNTSLNGEPAQLYQASRGRLEACRTTRCCT